MSIKGILILIVSALLFSIVFSSLNKSNPKLFSIFNKIPGKMKGKWYIRWTFILPLLIIFAIVQVHFELGDLIGYSIGGFILSLGEFAFRKPSTEIGK